MKTINYFKIFRIKESLNLDMSSLEKSYFSLQKKLHPDARKSEHDDKNNHFTLFDVNIGYKILKHKTSRAYHVLELNGYDKSKIKPRDDFLFKISEIIELNESKRAKCLQLELEKKWKEFDVEFENKIFSLVSKILGEILILEKQIQSLIN